MGETSGIFENIRNRIFALHGSCLNLLWIYLNYLSDISMTIQFLTDKNGKKKSALIPIQKWEELNALNQQLQRKLDVLTGIVAGVQEVKAARAGGKPLQTLSDFLDED